MLERLGYVVEIPIWPAQARERDLPGNIAKLLLYALAEQSADGAEVANDLANCVSRWIKPGENIYACPLVPYLSDKRMKNFLSTYALTDRTVRVNLYYLIRCDSAE